MKLFSLVLSVIVFFISLYFFIEKIGGTVITFNDYIYVSLLVILMAICITGVVINWGLIRKKKKSVVLFVSNNFSGKKKM